MFDLREKSALFIDGPNAYAMAKALNLDIDYKRLAEYFRERTYLLRSHYYTALREDRDNDYQSIRPLLDYLDYNGFRVVTKGAKIFEGRDGHTKVKGSMAVDIAVDIFEIADRINHIVLVSGDGDFVRLIEAVQAKGCKVSVLSSVQTRPAFVADELRRAADQFIEIQALAPHIRRTSNERSAA